MDASQANTNNLKNWEGKERDSIELFLNFLKNLINRFSPFEPSFLRQSIIKGIMVLHHLTNLLYKVTKPCKLLALGTVLEIGQSLMALTLTESVITPSLNTMNHRKWVDRDKNIHFFKVTNFL